MGQLLEAGAVAEDISSVGVDAGYELIIDGIIEAIELIIEGIIEAVELIIGAIVEDIGQVVT